MKAGQTVVLSHRRVDLALHCLAEASSECRPLLLLHGLGERTPSIRPDWVESWPGDIWGLDFTGHGESTVPNGGGYFPEGLMSDVDAAIAHLGEVTVLGRGLGAYVGLLIAGARPELVRGVVLDDGPGLHGGGPELTSGALVELAGLDGTSPDPYALLELSQDVRPPDYALEFVRQSVHLSGLDQPITVVAAANPSWLEAVSSDPSVVTGNLSEALFRYSTVSS
ncbi:MAG: alpha/beta hydrolase [Actinobacteria bacterium]|nr:alpha/beta hydrolase [Actinomycetota bacterium]